MDLLGLVVRWPVALALPALPLVLDAEILFGGAFRTLDLAVELVARLAVGELGRRVHALVGLLWVVLGQRLGLVLEAAELTHQISLSYRGLPGPLARPAGPAPPYPRSRWAMPAFRRLLKGRRTG